MQDVSQLHVRTNYSHSGWVSSRLPHGNHTVSSDRKFSTRSVSFSIPGAVFSPETSCIIRLFQFGVPEPLGTHVDRGSAVNHHQTFKGSWIPFPGCLFLGSCIPFPGCLFLGSWVPFPGCSFMGFLGPIPWLFSFLLFYSLRNHFAQVYDIDFVINRVNILLVRLGIWVFDLHLVYHLVVVCS